MFFPLQLAASRSSAKVAARQRNGIISCNADSVIVTHKSYCHIHLSPQLAASRSSATLSQRSSVTPLQQRPPSRQLLDSGTASGRHAGWGKENVVKHTSGGGNAAAGMPIPKSGKPPLGTPAKRLAPVPGTPAGKRLASASCKAGLPQLFAAGGGTVGGGGGIGLWGLAAAAKAEEPSAAARAAAELLAQRPAPRVFTRSTADR